MTTTYDAVSNTIEHNGFTFRQLAETLWEVQSQSDPERWYSLYATPEQQKCGCKSFVKNKGKPCKHLKAFLDMQQPHTASNGHPEEREASRDSESSEPLEARAPHKPVTSIPQEYLVELHGKPFITYYGLLQLAHQQGLKRITAKFISVTDRLALAEAEAVFTDGRIFGECADASPANVNSRIKPPFPRMALTRAKARALRDALNISLVAIEEVEEA